LEGREHHDHLGNLVRERILKLIQDNDRLKKEIEERKWIAEALRENEKIFRIHFSRSLRVCFWSLPEFRQSGFISSKGQTKAFFCGRFH
jgi:hypothetical protein